MQFTEADFLALDIAYEQLESYFCSTVRSNFATPQGACLYAFLLEVLDQMGLNDDLTIPEFMAWATKVYKERFRAQLESLDSRAA
ncbi:MAG: hypothetical protein NZR01_04310 [Bryobacteraceae bacterium]|nr:hypothetical protein [Bryobacteraceae bacterium]